MLPPKELRTQNVSLAMPDYRTAYPERQLPGKDYACKQYLVAMEFPLAAAPNRG
jgi:hypothetical protein